MQAASTGIPVFAVYAIGKARYRQEEYARLLRNRIIAWRLSTKTKRVFIQSGQILHPCGLRIDAIVTALLSK